MDGLMTATQAEEYMAMLQAPIEPLHPDLQAAYFEHESGLTGISHPLLHMILHAPQMNRVLNLSYAQKLEAMEQARAERNYWKIVHLHEKPYQLNALVKIEAEVPRSAQWWKLVRSVWTQIDNIHQQLGLWREVWIYGRSDRAFVMDRDERARLRASPPQIEVWRGANCQDYVQNGLSWTLDRAQAVWFACRFTEHSHRKPYLARGLIARENVLAMFDGGEREVVLDPDELIDIDVTPIRRRQHHQPGAWEL